MKFSFNVFAIVLLGYMLVLLHLLARIEWHLQRIVGLLGG